MSKKHSQHSQSQVPHKSLADVLKDDSNVISLAFEDGTPGRSNWSEFFDTLGQFLVSWNIKVVGIDKRTYTLLVQERIERQKRAQELAQGIASPTDQAEGQEVPAIPGIVLPSSDAKKEV